MDTKREKRKRKRKTRCFSCAARIKAVDECRRRCCKCAKVFCYKHSVALTVGEDTGHQCSGLAAHIEEWKAKVLLTKAVSTKLVEL